MGSSLRWFEERYVQNGAPHWTPLQVSSTVPSLVHRLHGLLHRSQVPRLQLGNTPTRVPDPRIRYSHASRVGDGKGVELAWVETGAVRGRLRPLHAP